MPKLGLLVGREEEFPRAFAAATARRDPQAEVQMITVGITRMAEPSPWDVIVDRASHRVQAYQSFLKNAALQGTRVINDPFMARADTRFLGAAVAARLGVPVPETVVLPNRRHVDGVVAESLRNRAEPLSWEAALDYLGFPMVLKPVRPSDEGSLVLGTPAEVLDAWNASGVGQYMLQRYVDSERVIRVFVGGSDVACVDRSRVREGEPASLVEPPDQVGVWAVGLANALGRAFTAFDIDIEAGRPLFVETVLPAPAIDTTSLDETAFARVVDLAATVALDRARSAQSSYRWDSLRPAARLP